MNKAQVVILSFGWALLATLASADSKVSGNVTDAKGEPIVDARISLTDPQGGYGVSFETDKKGRFFRRGVMPRKYTMKVEKEGFIAHIVEDVVVQAGVERTFEIQLARPEERQRQALIEAHGEGYLEGSQAFERGEFEKAISEMSERVAAAPDDLRARLMLAESLYKLARYEEAIPHFEAAMVMDPLNGELPQRIGSSHLKQGRIDQAMVAFLKAEGLSQDASVSYNIGALLMKEGKADEARAAFERALARDASFALALNGLAHVHIEQQNFMRALELLKAYLAAEPGAPDAQEAKLLIQELEKLTASN